MVDYAYYTGTYHGHAIPATAWDEAERDAAARMAYYKRDCTVNADDANSEKMAVCAMAEVVYEAAVARAACLSGGLVKSTTVGSVSTSKSMDGIAGGLDTSARAVSMRMWRAATQYVDIYAGVE